MAKNPFIRNIKQASSKPLDHQSAGILDDFAIRKDIQTKDGTFQRIIVGDQETIILHDRTNYISDTPGGAHIFLRNDNIMPVTPSSDTVAIFHNAITTSSQTKVTISGGALGNEILNFGHTVTENDGQINYSNSGNSFTFSAGGATKFFFDNTRATIITTNTDAILRFTGSGGNGQFVFESDNAILRWNKDLQLKSDSISLLLGDGVGGDAGLSYNGTDVLLDTAILGSGVLRFNNATNWTANGTATVTISNVAPAGVGTATISKWLTVKDDAGTVYYIPAWT